MQLNLFTTIDSAWRHYIAKVEHINEMYYIWVYYCRVDRTFTADKAEEIVIRDRKEMEAFKELQEELKDAI